MMNCQFEFNDKTYFTHPTYKNYAASEDGLIINRKTLNPRKGNLTENGYYMISPGRNNTCLAHRSVYEAVNQTHIPFKMQVNHIDSNRQNNSIENLQLVTPSENMIHMHKARKAFLNNQYTENELQIINKLMDYPPIEDNDCEFTRTENKLINKMYYRMCHNVDDIDFPLYRD